MENTAHTLSDILKAIKDYLESFLTMEDDKLNIVLNSVKKENDKEQEDVVITLLRIEEETSRKPQQTYYTETWKQGDETYRKVYPTTPDIEINLEILISSYAADYEYALTLISKVISLMNAVKTITRPAKLEQASFDIIRAMSISMMNISFEQHLSLWQTLGGNLVPSVAYKVRMITIEGIPDTQDGPLVEERVVEVGKMDTRGTKPVSLPPRKKTGENEETGETGETEDNKR